ncbi:MULTISPECIES: DUF2752 domain-containing protein [unclassified Pedobacter]|jgi:hypothetical protein|uniref:DUF2752 domain-containing protein n=1 Tax=unclassified Pedobacter TaxID=2628915 RepID=UPI001E513CD4|nr:MULTISPECIES: DUF2752 domain-containing protein [unclassified Pedobacter]HWW39274.1 DUF2752 domain-containing protein [Pedobacter sp.]
MKRIVKMLQQIPLELTFWLVAMILLATAQPHSHLSGDHFTFCPLANMGIKWCPGCGLGRSITQLFHGHLKESIEMHWFGIPATLLIFYRIGVLIKLSWNDKKRINLKNKEKDYV